MNTYEGLVDLYCTCIVRMSSYSAGPSASHVRPHPPHAVCTGSETQGTAAHAAGRGRPVAFALSRGWLEDLETAACSA